MLVTYLLVTILLHLVVRINKEIVAEAHEGFVTQMSYLYKNIMDSLSNTQVNFLKALIN
jgi:hypothetical protein